MAELRLRVRGTSLSDVSVELWWQGAAAGAEGLDLEVDPRDAAELRWLLEDPTVDLTTRGRGAGGRQRPPSSGLATVWERGSAPASGPHQGVVGRQPGGDEVGQLLVDRETGRLCPASVNLSC